MANWKEERRWDESIGAQMIAKGDIVARGVLPPESVINPGLFFAELEKRGISIHQKVE